ncbi:uncharacterized protein LOC135198333 [Macrobrachium nipponense]|uniref:uncharacterized protein LOC135198333 n=1 Tax=Macrobrachium nipponense TaxID=159736 RepID=UPI0030C87886
MLAIRFMLLFLLVAVVLPAKERWYGKKSKHPWPRNFRRTRPRISKSWPSNPKQSSGTGDGFIIFYGNNGTTAVRPRLSAGPECGSFILPSDAEGILYSENDQSAMECLTTIESPVGTTIQMSCPHFDLNRNGCNKEQLLVRDTASGIVLSGCKREGITMTTTSNMLEILHTRKPMRGRQCTGGFMCTISVGRGPYVTGQCGTYTLEPDHFSILFSNNDGGKRRCNYKIEGATDTSLQLICPVFDLTPDCRKEKLILKDNESREKTTFCWDDEKPDRSDLSNSVNLVHKRSPLRKKCSGGFLCFVGATGSEITAPPPAPGSPPPPPPSRPFCSGCGIADISVSRIVGGQDATAGEYPFIALIKVGGSVCGGSLIKKDWVVTAAHCFVLTGILAASHKGDWLLLSNVKRDPWWGIPMEVLNFEKLVEALDGSSLRRPKPEGVEPILLKGPGTNFWAAEHNLASEISGLLLSAGKNLAGTVRVSPHTSARKGHRWLLRQYGDQGGPREAAPSKQSPDSEPGCRAGQRVQEVMYYVKQLFPAGGGYQGLRASYAVITVERRPRGDEGDILSAKDGDGGLAVGCPRRGEFCSLDGSKQHKRLLHQTFHLHGLGIRDLASYFRRKLTKEELAEDAHLLPSSLVVHLWQEDQVLELVPGQSGEVTMGSDNGVGEENEERVDMCGNEGPHFEQEEDEGKEQGRSHFRALLPNWRWKQHHPLSGRGFGDRWYAAQTVSSCCRTVADRGERVCSLGGSKQRESPLHQTFHLHGLSIRDLASDFRCELAKEELAEDAHLLPSSLVVHLWQEDQVLVLVPGQSGVRGGHGVDHKIKNLGGSLGNWDGEDLDELSLQAFVGQLPGLAVHPWGKAFEGIRCEGPSNDVCLGAVPVDAMDPLDVVQKSLPPPPAPGSPSSSSTPPLEPFCSGCGIADISVSRIVGGQDATAGEYPFIALIKVGGSICGGSLIKKDWVVTAAHCFVLTGATEAEVFLGAHTYSNVGSDPNVQRFVSSSVTTHPDYDKISQDNDIALIYLGREATFNTRVQPICLGAAQDISAGDKAVVAGWGVLESGSTTVSETLQEVAVDITSATRCSSLYQNTYFISENMICALTEGKDSCQGDSGGPLVKQTSDGRWALVGVVSFGEGCANPDKPGVYTKISNYIDWITTTTGGSSC